MDEWSKLKLAYVQPLHNAAGQLEGIPLEDLPGDVAGEVAHLGRKVRALAPIMERVLAGKYYRCVCEGCTVQSSFKLGNFSPNLCGPCWNGTCDHPGKANHEENKRRGGLDSEETG